MMRHIRLLCGFDRTPSDYKMSEGQMAARESFISAVDAGDIVLLQREVCICGSAVKKPVSLTDRFGLPFGSYLCGECGLVYTSPYLSPASASEYYEKYYHDLHFNIPPSKDRVLYAKGQGRKIFELTRDRISSSDITVLEVGSGSGSVIKEFAAAAKETGINVRGIGLEYDSRSIASFDPEGFDIYMRIGGVDVLGQSDGPFDIVIMSHVLEHFPEPEKELNTLKRLLREDSLIYVEVPGLLSLRRRYKNYNCDYLTYFTGAHIFNFNLYSLAHLMNSSGFRLLWGNEEVESIFMPGKQSVDISDNARLVEYYIDDIETNLLFYQSLWAENAALKLVSERLSKRVDALIKDTSELKEEVRLIKRYLPYRVYNYLRRKIRARLRQPE